jgi:hypothetical protein
MSYFLPGNTYSGEKRASVSERDVATLDAKRMMEGEVVYGALM